MKGIRVTGREDALQILERYVVVPRFPREVGTVEALGGGGCRRPLLRGKRKRDEGERGEGNTRHAG